MCRRLLLSMENAIRYAERAHRSAVWQAYMHEECGAWHIKLDRPATELKRLAASSSRVPVPTQSSNLLGR